MTGRKAAQKLPSWLQNLLDLMAQQDISPRQLSLQAGLNPTAVRDMLSGRARNPRYDTLQAIAKVLDTTPAYLMGDAVTRRELHNGSIAEPDQLELLTEIIARLQETAESMRRKLTAKELASMTTTLYRQIIVSDDAQPSSQNLDNQARALVSYAMLHLATPSQKQAKRASS